MKHTFLVEALVPSACLFNLAFDTNAATTSPARSTIVDQYRRRILLGRIFSSVRYLATVRRAIGIPRLLKISTISLSLNGALPSSLLTRSRIASFTLVLLIDSPVAVW